MRTVIRVVPLLILWVLAAESRAGVNAGFTASVEGPLRIVGPQVGQVVRIPIRVDGTVELEGNVTTVRFDPTIVEFRGFEVGNITPGALPLSSPPVVREDGLHEIDGGSTLPGAGVTQATRGGLLGTFTFAVVSQLPEQGSTISVVRVEVNTSADPADEDALDFGPGQLGVALVPVFPNPIFNVAVERRQNGAMIRWNTRFSGFNDIGRVRARGSTGDFTQFASPLRRRFNDTHFSALDLVRRRALDLAMAADPVLVTLFRSELGLPAVTPDFEFVEIVRRVRELDVILRTRSHVIDVGGLLPTVEYEFELTSLSLDNKRSPTFRGQFNTRGEPDLRSLFVDQFDVQVGRTSASLSFGTNRPAETRYVVRQVGQADTVTADTLNEDGVTRTRIALAGLVPGAEYEAAVTVSLVDAAELVASGLPQEAAARTITRRFRTALQDRRLVMLRPPVKLVGSDRANIVFEANQPVEAFVDYGPVPSGSGKTAQGDTAAADANLYTWQQESTASLNQHNITISNLGASTLFRYKITLVNADGDTFTTDPRGNFQWSRDLQFRTAAAGDTLPPEVILGPVVDIRDVLVVVRFATDVPTSAAVFAGTEGGTYDTDDEFEFTDLTPDGERRFANRHSIIVSGLDAGATYRYRLVVESTAGKTTTYEPGAGNAKRAGVEQPPGGTGSFTTSNDPDTQFPVILSGPTVSSKSHQTAIIEWTTDEPSDSEVSFGVEGTDSESESSAVTTTSHKVVLSNLASGGTYTYAVASTDASGNGATQSSDAVFTTDPDVDLAAPQITVAPAVVYRSDETVTIQWTTDEDATGEVAFGTDPGSLGFIRALPTTDDVHEVTLTNLSPATTYFYQVSSSDLSNNGPTESSVTSFTTDAEADVTLPSISDIEIAAADCTVIITWATDEMADSFVDFGTVSGIRDLTVGDAEDVTAHELTLTNLAPGTTYYYTVGSIDRANNGPTASEEQFFTTLTSGDVTAPATPGGLSGTVGSQQVVLSWTANTELDLAGYNVYRRAGDAGSFSAIASRVKAASYTDLGLTNDAQYHYQITAVDRTAPPNESAASAALSFTPTLSAAPTAPTDLDVGGDPLLPTFTFTNAQPFTSGATLTYTIQVSTRSDFTDVTSSQSGIAAGSGTTTWTIGRTLDEGETYYWRVRAIEGALTGPFTDGQAFVASTAPLLAGDFNDSGSVDFDDFFLFVDAFGRAAIDYPLYDLNGSGSSSTIDFDDFFLFVDAFGTSAGKAGALWAFAHRLDETAHLRLETAGGPMGVTVDGQPAALPRDVVRLRVFVDDVQSLKAFGLLLTWDPSVLAFDEAREGPGHLLGSQGGDTGLFRVLAQQPGLALVGNGLVGGEPVSGSGLLAELSFRLLDRGRAGDSRIELQQAFLASSAGDVRRALAVEGARLLPKAFALGQAFPNPFNPTTHIDFALAADTPARLVIYDVLGRRVRTLVHAEDGLSAGFYSASWDGRDADGRAVASGLYFYRLSTPAFSRTGRMMLLE